MHERLNAYVGIYLGHLYREETELQQTLWDNFTDDALITYGCSDCQGHTSGTYGRLVNRDVPQLQPR